jgi:hypothetical protein
MLAPRRQRQASPVQAGSSFSTPALQLYMGFWFGRSLAALDSQEKKTLDLFF